MNILRSKEHSFGYTPLCEMNGRESDMLMDCGILRLQSGESFSDDSAYEKAFLLVYGEVEFLCDGIKKIVSRINCFDGMPSVLHLSKNDSAKITGIAKDSEIFVCRTENEKDFPSKLYEPGSYADEYRGKGLMNETSTRIVREVFGHSSAPYSNLVLGEVIGFPGKWSSYPPHHHPQPEVYYYKSMPENGFAFCDLGDEVLKIKHNDTVFIHDGQVHPHVTAPGYALWYLWVIRHLDGNPYIKPIFIPEHTWVTEKDAQFYDGPKAE
ncbi:MAG: 5-deoxy-glucuronate isomerase [Treponemataceae bacterium]